MEPAGSIVLTTRLHGDLRFAYVAVQHAAGRIGLLTGDEYRIVVGAVYHLHVYHVYRLKNAMDAHPPEGVGMPHAVRDALVNLQQVEALYDELKLPRPTSQEIHERLDRLEASDASGTEKGPVRSDSLRL